MSAADDSEQQQSAASAGPGERLRAAREAQELSFEDVVHELRLESTIIAAIECDDLDGLSAPVFVKGYLRSYARLVNLPEQEIVDAWQPGEPDPEEFLNQSLAQEIKTGASLPMFVLWCLLGIIVIAALLYLMLGGDDAPAEPAAADAEISTPAPAAPSLSDDFVVTEEAPAALPEFAPPVAEEVAVDTAPEQSPAIEPDEAVAEAEQPPADDRIQLAVSFTAECWVEVSADGRRLLYGLEKPGNARSFRVEPPVRFFVGNVDAVRIEVDGNAYTIPRSVRTGRNTARFVLTADDIKNLQ
ncbi:MAG: DUF4115 domain-containing protein [Gammaproteobacteria bacterium]|nr:DUF4115 domain-containing protein [Gammaproteobacteria bacterium]